MAAMRFKSWPKSVTCIADATITSVIARHRLTRICPNFSSSTVCLNSGSSSPSNVSQGKPAFSCRECGKSGKSSSWIRVPLIITPHRTRRCRRTRRIGPQLAEEILSAASPFYVKWRLPSASQVASPQRNASVRKIVREIGVEIPLVGHLYAPLLFARLLCGGGELRQAVLVGRIKIQEIVLVQFRHAPRQLHERFSALTHFPEQPRRRRTLDIVNLGALLIQRRGIGAGRLSVIQHLAQTLHRIEQLPGPVEHRKFAALAVQREPRLPAAPRHAKMIFIERFLLTATHGFAVAEQAQREKCLEKTQLVLVDPDRIESAHVECAHLHVFHTCAPQRL